MNSAKVPIVSGDPEEFAGKPIIEVQNVSKRYRLGTFGARSLREEAEMLWDRLRGRNGKGEGAPGANGTAGDFWALRDVSFSIQTGEVVGIIGRNGAGKSTLLKILSRITEPTSGEIIMRGRVASLLEVGTGFHPELTGRDNVYLNGAILGMKRAEIARKFDEIVAFAEIEKFIDTPVKRYSSGMYVRLAFAVAAHLEPEILIVDEVLAVGDIDFQRKCLNKMEDISVQNHRTILFVSHNVTAIRRLCERSIVMTAGRASPVLSVDEALAIYTQGQDTSESLVHLGDRQRNANQGKYCRIESIGIVKGGRLLYAHEGCIEVRFRVFEPVFGLMVGLGFNTPDGQRILTLDSDTLRKNGFDLDPGEHRIRVGLDCWPLHPANYSINVALICGHNCLDSVSHAAFWEVHTSNLDNVSDRGFGGCRPRPTIELVPSDMLVTASPS